MKGQLRIESLFAFVVVDDDDTEGVPAFHTRDGVMPMMGADLAMVEILRPRAAAAAMQLGKDVTLVHFSQRTEQEVFNHQTRQWEPAQ